MKSRRRILTMAATGALAAALLLPAPGAGAAQPKPPVPALGLTLIGRYAAGAVDQGAAEITAYDAASRRVFTVNAQAGTVDVLDLSDPAAPTKLATLDTPGANSVAVHGGLVAVAQQAAVKTQPGTVAFFRAADGVHLRTVTVGALPDMLTFTPDGDRVVVANEGEPDTYCAGGTDPAGSVSVVDLGQGVAAATVATAGFEKWDGREDRLRRDGVRIFGPGASASQDLEPEYVAVSADGRTAWVSLQENNAIATVDLRHARVEKIESAGLKDHSQPGAGLDPSDRDGGIRIAPQPVRGLYMPDALSRFTVGREDFVVAANEGDAREYGCYVEEARVKDLTLSPAAFPDAANLRKDAALGRLKVSEQSPRDAQGRVTELHAFGGRSISVRNAWGRVIWDSGDELEQLGARLFPADFNSDHDNGTFDRRSPAKGPEPEGVTVGRVGARTYAFVGLERISGVVAYDVTDPRHPAYAGSVSSRDFGGSKDAGTAGDLGPEGVLFVPAADSPNGRALLVVGHEVSGTTAVYEVG